MGNSDAPIKDPPPDDRWEKAVPGGSSTTGAPSPSPGAIKPHKAAATQAIPSSLYAKGETVHNQRIDGPFRRFKWFVMIVTLAIYYITPWLRWDRGPYAPDQAVLIDLANRRFYMFGIEIWPHEFYFVAGLLIMAGIGLFLVTSAVGRAWCGYACPQTVWTDVFQHVDRFFDGDRNARIRLDKAPWGPSKIARRTSKWAVYLLISFVTGGAWILYFADAPTLFRDFFTLDAAPIAYMTVGVLTATTFVLGGFMREQVCIYMCPWPRIQTAMLDEKSLIVTYKDWRGEKRGSLKKAQKSPEEYGDCIDCNQCVAVCPTGIDIREGAQIGCITCALCIDACDRVMAEIGRPRGLIDYATLEGCEAEAKGAPPQPIKQALMRPRTLIYLGVWTAIGTAMLFALGTRSHTDLTVSPDRNPPFMLLSDGSVRNAYTLRLRNMESRPREMEVAVTGLPGAVMWTDMIGPDNAATTQNIPVPADATQTVRAYVMVPEGASTSEFAFVLTSLDEQRESDTVTTTFNGPGEP
ncbi:cytochrome c oxidase accessory protein CcoG [Altererythrobacter lutimaris]|uniref:Cytochrome c oxidase accessory protein CcoG n=1 Tax=Altererythrobacter lutimaris TaxID=2743979 RepID=A0A850H933_9SPHN|nr:cytochrome c oxidase accessory protein CcoG [Altererythrobacter lutimaris]NVE93461.1 cytochrome c oxidase accessory protein CcoG [Altererythrobacter lutimaris]